MWKIETEIILVLKAHYMGRIFVQKDKNLQSILDSINFAINDLDNRNEKKDKIRQIFYIFLKIEILRNSHDIIDLRKRAKEISEKIGSNVFDYFIAVQEATSSIKKMDDIQTGIISNYKARIGFTMEEEMPSDSDYIKSPSDDIIFDAPDLGYVISGPAVAALDLEGYVISDKEYEFFALTGLDEMLEKHGLLSDTL